MGRPATDASVRLGARVRKLRKSRGMSIEDMLRMMPGTRERLIAIEKGSEDSSSATLERLAKALEVLPMDLVTSPILHPREKISELLRRFDPADLPEIYETVVKKYLRLVPR